MGPMYIETPCKRGKRQIERWADRTDTEGKGEWRTETDKYADRLSNF